MTQPALRTWLALVLLPTAAHAQPTAAHAQPAAAHAPPTAAHAPPAAEHAPPAAAHAQPAAAHAPPGKKPKQPLAPARDQNAISHKPFAITSRGLTLQYERLVTRRVSALGGLGARSAAREDFSSFTATVLTEGRYWLTGRDFATGYPGMAGPYLGASVVGSRTSVRNVQSDRSLGALLTLQESVRFGNRFVLWNLQEITAAVSMDIIHEFDERGRLAPNTRATLGFDFTVGWVF